MEERLPVLSPDQWRFLAVLHAMGSSVRIEILDILAPLTPGRLFDLMHRSKDTKLIEQTEDSSFFLAKPLPKTVGKKLDETCGREFLSGLIDIITKYGIQDRFAPDTLALLHEKSGNVFESARLECETADRELLAQNYETALCHLKKAVNRLRGLKFNRDTSPFFIVQAMKLSNLSLLVGRGINEFREVLDVAREHSKKLGDRRSSLLIDFHMGRMHWAEGRTDKAIETLSKGLKEVDELGDNDIVAQSAEFIGAYYFMKGQFLEAMDYLEQADRLVDVNTEILRPFFNQLYSYCGIYLGQFHKVIGFLDAGLRLAEENGNDSLSSVLGSILGTTLILLKRYQEAETILHKARTRALSSGNILGYYYSGGGLGLLSFTKGDLEKAYELFSDAVSKGSERGLMVAFASPWVVEVGYEFFRAGFKPFLGIRYEDMLEGLLSGINVHLKGVAYRLQARSKMDLGDHDKESVMSDLRESQRCLEMSGDSIQVAKTVLEMAHLELLGKNRKKAVEYANEAWRLYGGYAQDLFPDQYKSLLNKSAVAGYQKDDLLTRYFDLMNSIRASMGQEEILGKTIASTNQFFGAERGGLFRFPKGRNEKRPQLMAAVNLRKDEVCSRQFRPYYDLVCKAFQSGNPLVLKNDQCGPLPEGRILSVLCIPVEVQGRVRCVLYHDNSYLPDAFDHLNPAMMKLLGRHTSTLVNFILNGLRIREENERLPRGNGTDPQRLTTCGLIGNSPAMTAMIAMANQAAATDTTILIMGETGTGKGLLARWIHEKSTRAGAPFVVVDCTTIPENLFESELFGYEKGAFTGADRQKLGRFELAHKGTLFLDEIGEIPPQVQIKLLKTLEEKAFFRIGGGKVIRSDFRLIVATNRALKEEVAQGRFREDLFYRISIFPITMPPLRERGADIGDLARHFIEHYSREYGHHHVTLSKKDEEMLMKYHWPGNVRELQNIIERGIILSSSGEMNLHLSFANPLSGSCGPFEDTPTLAELQRRYIQHVLALTKGRISGPGGAAEILGMKRTSLYSRMRALRISKW